MKYKEIDWKLLKKDPLNIIYKWKKRYDAAVTELFTSSDIVELSKYNDYGYFHFERHKEHFDDIQKDWKKSEKASAEWIGKGCYPGIWTAMFDPCNTYSFGPETNLFMRFYFKDSYLIYDPQNQHHRQMFKEWEGENKENPWSTLKNEMGQSLEGNTNFHELPSHKKFYEENKFGAALIYSDYISPVILLEDSIKNVEFLEL